MSIKVEVSGPYALFSRPEMKTEHVSYDCMTPSAARGLLESIYWHPGLRWINFNPRSREGSDSKNHQDYSQ